MLKTTDDYKGELIREYRLKKEISQNGLARLIGVSSQFVCRCEKNWTPTPDKIFLKCVQILEIPEQAVKKAELKKVKKYLNWLYDKKKPAA